MLFDIKNPIMLFILRIPIYEIEKMALIIVQGALRKKRACPKLNTLLSIPNN
jgi:hypothetical protein